MRVVLAGRQKVTVGSGIGAMLRVCLPVPLLAPGCPCKVGQSPHMAQFAIGEVLFAYETITSVIDVAHWTPHISSNTGTWKGCR